MNTAHDPVTQISFPEIDDAVSTLQQNKARWAALPIKARIAYLEDIRDRVPHIAEDWVVAAVKAKGIAHAPSLAGEEWMSGPWAVLRAVKQMIEALENMAGGKTQIGKLRTRTATSGQTVVEVFPRTIFDQLLLNGIHAEIWMQPGVPKNALASQVGAAYSSQRENTTGNVGLVLGAGNISSIAPLDALYKLYMDLTVVMLKLNPVNDYLGPFIENIFASLIRDGFLHVAYGGAEVGAYLCNHPSIDTLHITGSIVTHDAIVFGAQKRAGVTRQRINNKPITSELGGVSPVIVVPGPWTKADIEFQAKNIATQRLHNGGFNCIASQAVVLPNGWDKIKQLEVAVGKAISNAPDRPAYYPGAEQRKERFRQHYGQQGSSISKPMGREQLLIDIDVSATQTDQFLYSEEAFAPVLGMAHIDYQDELDFLHKAIDFCNARLAGTLGANIIIHPQTQAKLGKQFEVEIARLKYGCVAVNLWTGVGFLLTETSWGAYPGHPIDDVQSGIGTVHNTMMFDRPEKSVLYGKFHPFPRSFASGQFGLLPTPPWFVSHKSAHKVAEHVFHFEAKPSWLKIPAIFFHALRS